MQSLLAQCLFSSDLQKSEKKKRNQFALERGRKIFSVNSSIILNVSFPRHF